MNRLVLDTNVVASSLLWSGSPRRLLHDARTGDILLFSSPPLLAELAEILERPKFAAQVAASLLSVNELVLSYAELITTVRPFPTGRIAPDPDDDVVIGTALAAQADLIVTGDAALLSVRIHQGIRLVTVRSALDERA